jgi:hypothetical protein
VAPTTNSIYYGRSARVALENSLFARAVFLAMDFSYHCHIVRLGTLFTIDPFIYSFSSTKPADLLRYSGWNVEMKFDGNGLLEQFQSLLTITLPQQNVSTLHTYA